MNAGNEVVMKQFRKTCNLFVGHSLTKSTYFPILDLFNCIS